MSCKEVNLKVKWAAVKRWVTRGAAVKHSPKGPRCVWHPTHAANPTEYTAPRVCSSVCLPYKRTCPATQHRAHCACRSSTSWPTCRRSCTPWSRAKTRAQTGTEGPVRSRTSLLRLGGDLKSPPAPGWLGYGPQALGRQRRALSFSMPRLCARYIWQAWTVQGCLPWALACLGTRDWGMGLLNRGPGPRSRCFYVGGCARLYPVYTCVHARQCGTITNRMHAMPGLRMCGAQQAHGSMALFRLSRHMVAW